MKKSMMKDIVLAVTYRCNSRCRMCSIWQIKDHEGEITIADLDNLPLSLENLNLSGGEPFLRDDLPELVAHLKKTRPNLRLTISSNGFATNLILEKMKEIIKFDSEITVAISLDGVEEAHNAIRGVFGGFGKVMETLQGLKEMGVKNLRLAFTIGDYNIPELKKVYQLAKTERVEMTVAAVHSSEIFFGKKNDINSASQVAEELEWLSRQELKTWSPKHLLRAYFAHGLAEFVKTRKRLLPDYSGLYNCFIDPLGEIYPNDISDQKIGNLKKSFELASFDKAECSHSWMICTVREAMRKHFFKVGLWILSKKLKLK